MDLGMAVVNAAAVVAIGGAAIALWQFLAEKYRRTLGSRRDLTRRLNELACGATIQYVEARFGAAVFRRDLAPELEYVEHIYRTPHTWLVIWYSKDEAAQVISITVTDPRYRFPTRWLTFDQFDVVLGRSTFSAVSKGYEGSRLEIGARRAEYVEAYYLGNPGHYAHYFLSYNDAGCGKFETDPSHRGGLSHWATGRLPAFGPSRESPPDTPDLATFRAGTTINTLTILAPGLDPSSIEKGGFGAKCRIGVDLDVVRMLRLRSEVGGCATKLASLRRPSRATSPRPAPPPGPARPTPSARG